MHKRITIIDDDQLILDTAGEFLRNAGYQVDTSDCPIRSNSLIYTDPMPDLLIIDVMMPLMTGDTKLKKLKSREDSRNIPVLLISAKPEEELKELAAESGADGYLAKPLTERGLLQAVRRLLRSG
jgi:DNA-binding response OmpR family regulator